MATLDKATEKQKDHASRKSDGQAYTRNKLLNQNVLLLAYVSKSATFAPKTGWCPCPKNHGRRGRFEFRKYDIKRSPVQKQIYTVSANQKLVYQNQFQKTIKILKYGINARP